MKTLKLISTLSAAFCLPVAAQAQVVNPSWYVLPTVSAVKPSSAFIVDRSGYGAGLRVGGPVAADWDLQLGGGFARSRRDGNDYRQATLGVDALYLFSRGPFRPFLLAGVGAERDRDVSAAHVVRAKNSPYVSVGIGFQSSITDQLSFQADVRDVHGFLRDRAFSRSISNNIYATVGLSYAFSKPPAPVVRMRAPEVARVVAAPVVAAPAPLPAPVRFQKVTLSSTELFAFDSATLSAPQPKLDEIADAMSQTPQLKNVVVTGYTDRLGGARHNLDLSTRRANAVKSYLLNKGVSPDRLLAVGKGSADPVVVCNDKRRVDLIKCLEPNRRVEVGQVTFDRRLP